MSIACVLTPGGLSVSCVFSDRVRQAAEMSSDLVFLLGAVSLLTLTSDPALQVLVESHRLCRPRFPGVTRGKASGGLKSRRHSLKHADTGSNMAVSWAAGKSSSSRDFEQVSTNNVTQLL